MKNFNKVAGYEFGEGRIINGALEFNVEDSYAAYDVEVDGTFVTISQFGGGIIGFDIKDEDTFELYCGTSYEETQKAERGIYEDESFLGGGIDFYNIGNEDYFSYVEIAKDTFDVIVFVANWYNNNPEFLRKDDDGVYHLDFLNDRHSLEAKNFKYNGRQEFTLVYCGDEYTVSCINNRICIDRSLVDDSDEDIMKFVTAIFDSDIWDEDGFENFVLVPSYDEE